MLVERSREGMTGFLQAADHRALLMAQTLVTEESHFRAACSSKICCTVPSSKMPVRQYETRSTIDVDNKINLRFRACS